jgi:hypothetical protein
MKKSLLIFAWEYDGYHSVQGTALARRITQVADAFNGNDWDVTVIHRDHRDESKDKPYKINTEKDGIKRICVKSGKIDDFSRNALVRKMETLYYAAFHGDRTYKWAKEVVRHFDSFGSDIKPDLLVSFYTPRAPIFLGHYFSKKLKAPWIADIQDPMLAGISKTAKGPCRAWMRRMLKPAKSIVHISPEWAAADAKEVNLPIKVIRHAVPENAPLVTKRPELMDEYKDYFTIFYGGSLSGRIQSLELLKKVVSTGPYKKEIKILVAGNANVYNLFREQFGETVVKHLGWLSPEQMREYVAASSCTLLIPWSQERVGIPSKFYELCSYPRPIWIIGYDLGAFSSLLHEWKSPELLITDPDFQKKALTAAMNDDYSLMFNLEKCRGKIIRANDLYDEYIKLA